MKRKRVRDWTAAARANEASTQRLKRAFGWAIVAEAKERLGYGRLDDKFDAEGYDYNPRRWDYVALMALCRDLTAQGWTPPAKEEEAA